MLQQDNQQLKDYHARQHTAPPWDHGAGVYHPDVKKFPPLDLAVWKQLDYQRLRDYHTWQYTTPLWNDSADAYPRVDKYPWKPNPLLVFLWSMIPIAGDGSSLLYQGWRKLREQDVDELDVVLSVAGLALDVSPWDGGMLGDAGIAALKATSATLSAPERKILARILKAGGPETVRDMGILLVRHGDEGRDILKAVVAAGSKDPQHLRHLLESLKSGDEMAWELIRREGQESADDLIKYLDELPRHSAAPDWLRLGNTVPGHPDAVIVRSRTTQADARLYEWRVFNKPDPQVEIKVGNVSFDWYEGNTLLDAKFAADGEKSIYNLSRQDGFIQNVKEPEIRKKIKDQLAVLQNSSFTQVEWVVSDPTVKEALEQYIRREFQDAYDDGLIKIRLSP